MCSSHLLGDDEGRGHAQYPSFLLALHNGGWFFFWGGGLFWVQNLPQLCMHNVNFFFLAFFFFYL